MFKIPRAINIASHAIILPMSSRAERIRREMRQSSLFRHSMDSETMHYAYECEKMVYRDDKAARAEKARMREEEFKKDFPVYQFERALTKLADGEATSEDVSYLRRHNDEFVNSPVRVIGNKVILFDLGGFERRRYQKPERRSLEDLFSTV